jgi:hypothetical protein
MGTVANDIISGIWPSTGEMTTFREVTTWYDGSSIDDSKVDNIIYTKLGIKYYRREFTEGIKLEWFGAKGDGVTDDTQAVKDAANFVSSLTSFHQKGRTPLIQGFSSKGYKITDTIVFTGAMNIDISTFIYAGTQNKTAIRLIGQIDNIIKLNVRGPSNANVSNSAFQGLVIENAYRCTFHIQNITSFTRGLVCLAKDGIGFAWNNIHLGAISGCKHYLVIKSETNGWPNANNVYGGDFDYNTGDINLTTLTSARIFVKQETDGEYEANSWNFFGQQFETGEDTSAFNGQETLVFTAESWVIGFNFVAPRIEYVNANRLAIVQKGTYAFNIETDKMYVSQTKIVYPDNTQYYPSVKTKLLVQTDDFSTCVKVGTSNYLVKKYETMSIDNIWGLGAYLNMPGVLIKIDNPLVLRVTANKRLRYSLFDETQTIIRDSGLLSTQLTLTNEPAIYGVVDNSVNASVIRTAADQDIWDVYMGVIPEAKYIFFFSEEATGTIRVEAEEDKYRSAQFVYRNKFVQNNPGVYFGKYNVVTYTTNGFSFTTGDTLRDSDADNTYLITNGGSGANMKINKKGVAVADSAASDIAGMNIKFNELLASLRNSDQIAI